MLAGGDPGEAASREFLEAFNAKYGPTKLYAPFFYDAANVMIEAMVKADSIDPAKFTPEVYRLSLDGATGQHRVRRQGRPQGRRDDHLPHARRQDRPGGDRARRGVDAVRIRPAAARGTRRQVTPAGS